MKRKEKNKKRKNEEKRRELMRQKMEEIKKEKELKENRLIQNCKMFDFNALLNFIKINIKNYDKCLLLIDFNLLITDQYNENKMITFI